MGQISGFKLFSVMTDRDPVQSLRLKLWNRVLHSSFWDYPAGDFSCRKIKFCISMSVTLVQLSRKVWSYDTKSFIRVLRQPSINNSPIIQSYIIHDDELKYFCFLIWLLHYSVSSRSICLFKWKANDFLSNNSEKKIVYFEKTFLIISPKAKKPFRHPHRKNK